jgi:hypothetical protein
LKLFKTGRANVSASLSLSLSSLAPIAHTRHCATQTIATTSKSYHRLAPPPPLQLRHAPTPLGPVSFSTALPHPPPHFFSNACLKWVSAAVILVISSTVRLSLTRSTSSLASPLPTIASPSLATRGLPPRRNHEVELLCHHPTVRACPDASSPNP